jgi:hypothetical protein
MRNKLLAVELKRISHYFCNNDDKAFVFFHAPCSDWNSAWQKKYTNRELDFEENLSRYVLASPLL